MSGSLGPFEGERPERLVARAGGTAPADGDEGVALVELLALAGDLLGLRADAVAAEAYLGGRRHRRLAGHRRRFAHGRPLPVRACCGIYSAEVLVGASVWIAHEGGDRTRPAWLGLRVGD